jgi:aryl sulfotransferase
MTHQFPTRNKTYDSATSVSKVWEQFAQRPGDVFICTPPKSGTTWMQSICGMLIFGDAAVNPGIGSTSRWLDSAFNDHDEVLGYLEAQTHRRYIKTHTPLDGIPYEEISIYLAVYRHPIDVFFSGQNHMKNMKGDHFSHLIAGDINEGFQTFVREPTSVTEDIGDTLESLVNHYLSFARWQTLPNIHLFHYADMTRDLRHCVATVSDRLSCDYGEDLIDAITSAASFSSMKKEAAKYAPSADRGIWKDNAGFFESGTSNKGEGVLNETSLSMYQDRMSALLAPEEQAWFEFGAGGSA